MPDEVIDRVFAVMALCPHLTFMVLTKRADRMRKHLRNVDMPTRVRAWMEELGGGGPIRHLTIESFPLPNVWLGVSVERQEEADERIPDLLATPAAVRFISAEPLLGPIDLVRWAPAGRWGKRPERPSPGSAETFVPGEPVFVPVYYMTRCEHCGWVGSSELCGGTDDEIFCPACLRSIRGDDYPSLDWVIAGFESGPDARPGHPDWVRSLRDQCGSAATAFFFKQWGTWAPDDGPDADGRDPIFEGRARCATWDGHRWTEWESGHHPPPDTGIGAWVYRVGKKRAGRRLDGVEHNGLPKVRHG